MAVDLVRGCYGSIGEPGDWNYRELTPQESYRNFIVDDKERNDCICSLAREAVRRGLPTAIIVRQVPHVRKLRMMLRDLRVAAIFGQVKRKQRTRAKVAMDSGNLDVIICNKVFTKGINIKRLSVVIDAASNRDPSDAQQKFGRGVRLYEGKLGLIYIDVGDRRPPRGENIFQASTNARRKAIESLSVYKIRSVWDGRPDLIFDKAELYLKTSSV